MEMKYLDLLVGKKITDLQMVKASYEVEGQDEELEVDELMIIVDEYTLLIANPIETENIEDLGDLLDLEIKAATETDQSATFFIGDDMILAVDLREASKAGPEAMSLTGPDDLVVVWGS